MSENTYSAVLSKFKGNDIQATINETVNIERLKTMYYGYDGPREIEVRFVDPRRFRVEQRLFIFNLIGDIHESNGQPLENLKEIFYWRFEAITGRAISLKNESKNTVEDVTILADIILDFIFEENIPFRNGYEILQGNREYFFYKCLMTRTCCICGKKNAEIDHFDEAVGNRKRKKIDHSDFTFAALCGGFQTVDEIQQELFKDGAKNIDTETVRTIISKGGHHAEKHIIGVETFKNKYHIKGIKLNDDARKKLRIGG